MSRQVPEQPEDLQERCLGAGEMPLGPQFVDNRLEINVSGFVTELSLEECPKQPFERRHRRHNRWAVGGCLEARNSLDVLTLERP